MTAIRAHNPPGRSGHVNGGFTMPAYDFLTDILRPFVHVGVPVHGWPCDIAQDVQRNTTELQDVNERAHQIALPMAGPGQGSLLTDEGSEGTK